MRSSFLEYWIYGRYNLMSSVIVFIEIILLFVAAFVTHFYLQRWKQVITNDIISGIFRGIECKDSWEPTQIVSKKNRISSFSILSQLLKL